MNFFFSQWQVLPCLKILNFLAEAPCIINSITILELFNFFSVALRPDAVNGLLIFVVLNHTQRLTTVDRTPLDEWSARRRDLYLIKTTLTRQTSMLLAGFEPTISADERPQTYALQTARPLGPAFKKIRRSVITNERKITFYQERQNCRLFPLL